MAKKRLKVGDRVRVIVGKDRGKKGTIEFFKGGKAVIPGVNEYKKHVKKGLTKDGKGGIFDVPSPIDLSNLAKIKTKKK